MELKPKKSADSDKTDKYDLEKLHGPRMRELLEPGESLLGIAVVNWQQSMFKQTVTAIAVTGERLILQPLSRKGKFDGDPFSSIRREEIAKGSYGGGGSGDSPSSMIMDAVSIQVKVKTTGGEKYKFALMTGDGIFGKGASPSQRNGAEALISFLDPGSSI